MTKFSKHGLVLAAASLSVLVQCQMGGGSVEPQNVVISEAVESGSDAQAGSVLESRSGRKIFVRSLSGDAQAGGGKMDIPDSLVAQMHVQDVQVAAVQEAKPAPVQEVVQVETVEVVTESVSESEAVVVSEANTGATKKSFLERLFGNSSQTNVKPEVATEVVGEVVATEGAGVSVTAEKVMETTAPVEPAEANNAASVQVETAVAAQPAVQNAPGTIEGVWTTNSMPIRFGGGKYVGNSGCNEFSGTYLKWFGDKIKIFPMKFSGVTCDSQAVAQSEIMLEEQFPGTYELIFDGSNMILSNAKSSWLFAPATGG